MFEPSNLTVNVNREPSVYLLDILRKYRGLLSYDYDSIECMQKGGSSVCSKL